MIIVTKIKILSLFLLNVKSVSFSAHKIIIYNNKKTQKLKKFLLKMLSICIGKKMKKSSGWEGFVTKYFHIKAVVNCLMHNLILSKHCKFCTIAKHL